MPASYTWISSVRQRFAGPCRAYPELFAVLGGNVPDLRGLFLRGHGGKASPLKQRQADSVHIPASAGITITLSGISRGSYTYKLYHVAGDQNYSTAYCAPTDMGRDNPMNGIIAGGQMSIPLTIISPSQETRPENMAVRYLIRARP
ncbi:hypothetical protein [uncultured Desulfovibrio sp.]|uniref:hypothetical protein n=2 Tax=uncultured Desulfovibrio sp. TaxID=167968 RepID=UPI00261EDC93|nr:hypothetical protein [uncultured Desulfovibrio sp.]